MKQIELIKDFDLNGKADFEKDKHVNEIFNGAFRRIVEVRLQNSAVLSRHKADVPITVFCLSGSGIFTAGKDLEDSQDLRAGTLITLEAGIEHEVTADPSLQILVTKFMDS
jgi:quercetin dioxygenase-like cupin family protein